MVATRSARRRGTPLLALWRREDARAAVVDFLPTETIAVLAMVAKPLREAQSCLLHTAIRRRGKTLPSPPTTRACLDALFFGETQYLCEKWERGLEDWINVARADAAVKPFHGVGSCLELTEPMGHRGFARPLRARNLLVTRYRVAMSYVELSGEWSAMGKSVGYALLCGPSASTHPNNYHDAAQDCIGGPRFRLTEGVISLIWFHRAEESRETRTLVEDVAPNTPYIVDATFNHESVTSCLGTVDITVNGQTGVRVPVVYNPLSSIHLYNFSPGIARIGDIEIWYKKAAPNQAWRSPDPAPWYDDSEDDSEDSYLRYYGSDSTDHYYRSDPDNHYGSDSD